MTSTIALPDGTLTIDVVDSHTGGEPTRVVVDGFPQLRGTTLLERRADLAARHRRLATAIVDEPRGNEPMVGALLTEPVDPALRGRRDLLRPHPRAGHVRPRDDRAGRDAAPARPHRPGRAPHRDTRRRRRRSSSAPTAACRSTTSPAAASSATWPSTSRRSAGSPATSPTAATCSSSSPTPTIDLDRPRAELLRIAADVMHSLHAAGLRRRRPRRAVRPADVPGGELAQLRAVPERDLRPLAVRHRHERQGRRPGRGRSYSTRARPGSRSRSPARVLGALSLGGRGHGPIVPTVTGTATITGEARLFLHADECRGSRRQSMTQSVTGWSPGG